ncbi:MAG TPA: S8 family serine peptidase [Gaiellaceae bacterium]|nr:S8 family serine peptidase [Gaiellaceae bacterium]
MVSERLGNKEPVTISRWFAGRTLLAASFTVFCLAAALSPTAHGAARHARLLSSTPAAKKKVTHKTAAVTSALRSRSTAATPTGTTGAAPKISGLTGVPIAIVDTGVTATPDLGGRVVGGTDLTGAGGTADGNGHGTAMASIASGGTNGVCPVCTIMPVRAVGNAGLGTTQLATQGVAWAAAHGARVINLSLTTTADDPGLTAAINNAVNAGIVVVVAAGNAGSADPSAEGFPGASATGAISVASANGTLGLYPWSNYGPWVQLAAPGSLTAETTTGKTFTAVGTSASAAYISGVVGLMLSCNPQLNPAQVRSILLGTGTPLATLGTSGHIVNVTAAVAASSSTQACQIAAQTAASAG